MFLSLQCFFAWKTTVLTRVFVTHKPQPPQRDLSRGNSECDVPQWDVLAVCRVTGKLVLMFCSSRLIPSTWGKTRLIWLSGLKTQADIWKLSCALLASSSTPSPGICTSLLTLLILKAKLFTISTIMTMTPVVVKEMPSVEGTILSFLKSYLLYSHLSCFSSAQGWFSSLVKM